MFAHLKNIDLFAHFVDLCDREMINVLSSQLRLVSTWVSVRGTQELARMLRRPRVENVDLRRPRVGNVERLRLLHQFLHHIHPTRLQRVLHSSIHTCITGKCLYLLNEWYNTVRSLHTGCLDKGKDICSLGYGGASVVDSKLPVPSRARSTNS